MVFKRVILFKLAFVFTVSLFTNGWAQNTNTRYDAGERVVNVSQAVSEINIDGVIDEPTWNQADKMDGFYQYFPLDTIKSVVETEIQFSYDQKFLYVAINCRNIRPGGYVTPTLRRDFRGRGNDGIHLLLDTFDDQTNAFLFGVNPYNVQREGLISNSGNGPGSFSLSWDNKWYSAVIKDSSGWSAEMAIPFKTLRFKEGSTQWRVNAFRIDSKASERSTWGNIPRNFSQINLGFSGLMIFDKPLKRSGPNISVIPYTSAGLVRNHEDNEDLKRQFSIGGDAKIALSSSLNLDLTVNPDFSQVEVDQQVTNLDRFEIFFPERRQFFLENADLFGNFGSDRIRPFFSRRIGIAEDTINNVNVQNKIQYGMRLSGKLNKYWRVGLLNMQTEKDDDIGLRSNNYTVGVIERRLFQRSTLSAFLVNKQSLKNQDNDKFTLKPDVFNRIIGLDYNLATNNNKWSGKFFYHRLFDQMDLDHQYTHGSRLEYRVRRIQLQWVHESVGENYDATVGFVPRKGYNRINPRVRWNFYPSSRIFNRHGPRLQYAKTWNGQFSRTDEVIGLNYRIDFQNLARFNIDFNRNFTFLLDNFDPSRLDQEPLPSGTSYTYNNVEIEYQSDLRKALFVNMKFIAGQFFNGNIIGSSGDINFRAQPLALITLNYSLNRIRLPEPYGDADLFLIGPRLDLTFSRKIFLTTFVQYNNQIDNLNINTRFQWRFKPVSDLFIVYTDNYLPQNLKVKNRALILKLTYWINL